jgi:hypothetical protein
MRELCIDASFASTQALYRRVSFVSGHGFSRADTISFLRLGL